MSEICSIIAPLAGMTDKNANEAALVSELLHGETVTIIKRDVIWTLVENSADRHTGYVRSSTLGPETKPTHVITALGSFLYKDASLKSHILGRLSFLSKITVLDTVDSYAKTPHGYVHVATIAPIDEFRADPVDTARRFIGVPYKWGGRSSAGLDCSSLTQLSFAADGIALPKNAGPQRKVLPAETNLETVQSGDLLFLPGHVMISSGDDKVVHANGVRMVVCEMNLDEALAERGKTRADVIVKKRPTLQSMIDRPAFLALSGPDIMS